MTAERQGALVQVDPPGPTLVFQYNPESLTREPRKPRLSSIDRPRRVSATEWEGKTPFKISFTLFLDGLRNDIEGDQPVVDQMAQLEGFASVHPNIPPRRLRLLYSGYSPVLYIVEDLSWGEEIRREDLAVIRVSADITLREWQAPDVAVSPAKAAQERPAPTPPAEGTHTVRSGETLWAIAAQHLGDGAKFPAIAELNGLRDPNTIRPGQRLRLPAR